MRDHETRDTQEGLVSVIRYHYQRRVDFHRAEKKLTLQIRAICRRLCHSEDLKKMKRDADKLYVAMFAGDQCSADTHSGRVSPDVALRACGPMIMARKILGVERKKEEKKLTKLAKQLPVWEWVETVRGVGPLSLANIIGEARDLSNYANPAKLWKRMGLALIGDKRQGSPGKSATAEDWIEHGYCAARRSVMWTVGDCIVKSCKEGSEYRDIYNAKKEDYLNRPWCGGCHIKEDKGEDREHCTDGHAHNRAQRYTEKRFLRDLWRVWRNGSAKEEIAA